MPTDVGILTVLPDCELPAVLRAFKVPRNSKPERIGAVRYWKVDLPTSSEHPRGTLRLVITAIGEAGNADASAATTALLKDHRPSLVCLVGIAAGVQQEISRGDVVLARGILGYEMEKLRPGKREGKPQHKEPPFPIRNDLAHFFGRIPATQLSKRIKQHARRIDPENLPPADMTPERYKVKWPYVIASGEKIFGDGTLEQLSDQYHDSRIIAGEMEGIGFAVAAEREGCAWAVIRGISDHGDPKSKDGRYKDRFHHLASISAAEVTRLFLELGYSGPLAPDHPVDVIDLFRDSPPIRVKRVLITAHDKYGLEPLIEHFNANRVEIVATPNTAKHLRALGCKPSITFEFTRCRQLSFVRGTLHPYILGAIAADPRDVDQLNELSSVGVGKIDLVIVNTKDPHVPEDASSPQLLGLLSDVQIGGPSLLRWTIKQWRTCAAVVDPSDYQRLLHDLQENNNEVSATMRSHLLSRALQRLADRDQETAKLLNALWPTRL
jgi:nucleoside phosphorylase